MSGYVLKCHGNGKNDGKFVARSGSEHSYTDKLQNAECYPDAATAQRNACGNESVHPVSEFLSVR